jgi:hypothetical protein
LGTINLSLFPRWADATVRIRARVVGRTHFDTFVPLPFWLLRHFCF